MNKKKIEAEADPHAEDFAVFMEEFLVDSDRASVVLGAAKIDALLCSLLDHYLIPNPGTEDDLLEGDSPLGTFSARIKMCHRLGLIDAHFAKLLHVFRRLRNAFAHEVTPSSLSVGSARDRIMVLATPFTDSKFYNQILRDVAKNLNRSSDDPGVMFRAVLAIFHLELQEKMRTTKPLSPPKEDSIVDTANSLK